MSGDIPITVGVWEKRTSGWGKVSEIRTWTDLGIEPRYNQPGTWSLQMPFDPQAYRITNKHLLTFDFRGTRMTGVIEKMGPRQDEVGAPVLELSGSDALTLLGDALCWPAPALAVEAQTADYVASGPAETVLRDLIFANMVTRRGDDMVVSASQARGRSISVNERFSPVLAVVTAKAEAAGLGVRMGLVNTTSGTRAEMRAEFFTPVDRSNRVRLSHKVGTLRTWKQEDAAPSATSAVIQAVRQLQTLNVASVNTSANTITTAVERNLDNKRVLKTVKVATNTISTSSPHKLGRGDRITFTGGTPPAPLGIGTDYYAIRVDADTFMVASTYTNARARRPINLLNDGAGSTSVNRVTITGTDNKLRTGDIVTVTGGTPPAPLVLGVAYYAIRVADSTFQVARTKPEALDDRAIDLTSAGSGEITVTEQVRRYREVNDDAAETEWGRKRETFLSGGDEDSNGELDAIGEDALLNAAAQSAFELESAEAEGMRYGEHYQLGDKVMIELLTGVTKVDTLRAAKIAASSESGVTVQLVPGDPDAVNPLFRQAAIVRGIRRQVQALERRES